MYMLREVYRAERGKAPDIVAAFSVLDQVFEETGYRNRRLYVDIDGPMDTVVYQFEVDSLDQYFVMERAMFVDPDDATKALIHAFNDNATSGYREIFEVIQ